MIPNVFTGRENFIRNKFTSHLRYIHRLISKNVLNILHYRKFNFLKMNVFLDAYALNEHWSLISHKSEIQEKSELRGKHRQVIIYGVLFV